MGNSTISLRTILDRVAAKGIPTPLTMQLPGSGPDTALAMGNDVMAELIKERFNWKWNRSTAASFFTNSFQQDYPMPGISTIGWLEDADRVDINNTAYPKPLRQLTVRKQMSRTSQSYRPIEELCWMYNNQLSLGTWPGANMTFYPLVSSQVKQNPLMSMLDKNGNILIVTTFGTTGSVAPFLPASSADGLTVNDGSVVWTCCGPTNQGFRVNPLPGSAGPVYQVIPYYQNKLVALTTLGSFINPIPDDSSQYFQTGMEAYCLKASPNPGDKQRGEERERQWLKALEDIRKQGDREADAYGLLPASQPVDSIFAWVRNPQDPSQPY